MWEILTQLGAKVSHSSSRFRCKIILILLITLLSGRKLDWDLSLQKKVKMPESWFKKFILNNIFTHAFIAENMTVILPKTVHLWGQN